MVRTARKPADLDQLPHVRKLQTLSFDLDDPHTRMELRFGEKSIPIQLTAQNADKLAQAVRKKRDGVLTIETDNAGLTQRYSLLLSDIRSVKV